MKKFALIILSVLLAASLFGGCQIEIEGNTGEGNASHGTKKVTSEDPPVIHRPVHSHFDPYETMDKELRGTTVRFATYDSETLIKAARPLANIYDDIQLRVELVTIPKNKYVDSIITSIASGNVPDAFISNKNHFPLTLQITAPIDVVSTVNLDEPIWHKSMLECGTINDHVYLVNTIGTQWAEGNLLFYNKAIFEDNGFTTPEEYYEQGKWTWSTLQKAMKDVDSLGDDYYGGYIPPEILGDSLGASFCLYDYKTNSFSNGSGKRELAMTYQYYLECKEQGLLAPDLTAFKNGKCGVAIADYDGLKNTGYFKDMNWNYIGYTYLPATEEGKRGKVSSDFVMFGIVDGCRNPDAAGYFLRYWLDPKNYDLSNVFLSNKAGNFYYSLTNTDAEDKFFSFDNACLSLLGSKAEPFNVDVLKDSAAAVPTRLKEASERVDAAVQEANKMINDIIARHK